MINAGGDVTLAGSQVKGKRVELDAENLNIESLQDKSSYHGKQMNMLDRKELILLLIR